MISYNANKAGGKKAGKRSRKAIYGKMKDVR
jgi:hypothetical protein